MKILYFAFGISAPIEISLEGEERKIYVYLRPLKLRTVLSLMAKAKLHSSDTPNISIPADYVFNAVLEDGVEAVVTVDGERLDVKKLNPAVQQKLFDLILIANGLTHESQQQLQRELDELRKSLIENLRRKDSPNLSPHSNETAELAFLANIAYSALSSGRSVSAPTLLDEPYLLLMLALTASQAEKEWLDEKGARMQARAGDELSATISETLPIQHLVPHRPLEAEEVKDVMKRIAEAIHYTPR